MIKTLSSQLEVLESEVQNKLTEMLASGTSGISGVIADQVTTSNGAVDLPVILPVSGMEEWLNSKNVRSLYVKDLLTKVRNFHLTVEVNAYDFEDEQFGLYSSAINGMLGQAQKQYDKLVCEVLTSNPTTVTGLSLFSDTQKWGSEATTQDNNLALALDETNLGTAVAALETFKDQNGEPLARQATHLIVPPQLKVKAMQLTAAVFGGAMQVVVSPYLSGASTTWYVADCVNGKPVSMIERMAPKVTTVDKSAEKGTILVTVDMRAVAVPTVWCNIVKSVG